MASKRQRRYMERDERRAHGTPVDPYALTPEDEDEILDHVHRERAEES